MIVEEYTYNKFSIQLKMLCEGCSDWKGFDNKGMDEFKVKSTFSILLENYPYNINLCMLYYVFCFI